MTTLIPKIDFKNGGATPTGAVNRPINLKIQESISVLDFGAVGDGVTECSQAIQNAINYTTSIGASLFFPAGTYIVDALQTINQQTDGSHPPTRAACFKMTSDLHCFGVQGSTIIKAKSGISTNASPKYFNMFMSNTYDVNVSFDGITFDLNGQNNVVSPNAPSSYNYYHQAALFWGSDVSNVARPDNLHVNNCKFINCAGTNQIVTGFSITTPAPQGTGFILTNCLFDNNGFNTDDHSSVYAFSTDTLLQNNVFTISTATVIRQCAWELHGSNSRAIGNSVRGYVNGCIVVGGTSGTNNSNFTLAENFFYVTFNGIYIFRNATGSNTALSDISIYANVITLKDGADNYPQDAAGIYIIPTYPVQNVYVYDNTIQKVGGYVYACYGLCIGNVSTGLQTDGLQILNNTIDGFTKGISLPLLTGVGSFGRLYIVGNTIKNCYTSTTPVMVGKAIELAINAGETMEYVNIQNNSIFEFTLQGIYLQGTINIIYYGDGNVILSALGTSYVEQSTTIAKRYGVLRWNPQTFNPGTIANGASSLSAGFTVTGAALGDAVAVGAPYDLQGCTVTGYVSATDTIKILVTNNTGGSVTLASGTWQIRVSKQGV